MRCALFPVLLVLATLPAAHAQPTAPVGEITRIAEEPRRPVAQTTRAELWRIPGQPVRKRAALVVRDRLELKDDVWIDLRLRRSDLDARVVLAPLNRRGVYRIEPGMVTEVAGLRLVVERGALLVELLQGELEALAADVSMLIHGTTVLIEADSTGAYCFLREGRISFPAYGIGYAGENQMWRLLPGQRPERVALDAAAERVWRDQTRTTALAVRPVPLWRKPAFLVGAAVVVVGSAAYLLRPGGSASPRARAVGGVVTIPIPR